MVIFILTIFKYLGKGEKMKNRILYTAILLFGLLMIAIAQEPISIRSQSLGNVIEDDWDLIYDPIELRFVNGNHFFTNMADFNEMDNDVMVSNPMEPTFLPMDFTTTNNKSGYPNDFSKELPIGFAFKNPIFGFLKHAFLLRLKNSKEAESANNGYGEYEYDSSNYYDGDNDGLYDSKTLSSGKYINYDIDRRTAFILNNNLKMGPMTFGWELVADHQFSEDDEALTEMGVATFGDLLHGTGSSAGNNPWDSWNNSLVNYGFDESTTHYLIEDDFFDYTSLENGSFLTIEEDSYAKSHMAFMMDLGLELRADLINQALLDGRIKTNDYYSGDYTKYDDADMQDYEAGTITETYKRLTGGDGSVHKLGGSVKGVFDKRDKRKNDGFWQLGAMLGTSLGNYESSSYNQLDWTKNRVYSDTTNLDWRETRAEHQLVSDAGNYDGSSMDIFGRLHVPIGKIINLGIGGFYNYNKTTRNTDYISETTTATEYIYNGSFDDSQDYTSTANKKLVADRTYETQYATYRIPVGLEFRMPKDALTDNDLFSLRNFSFRIGTTFISSHTIINDKHQITDFHPQITTTEYGDGDVNIDINDTYYTSTSIRTENIIGEKQFSAGIGYRHSENLQIDLGGYGGEDVAFVGISFTVKLDIIEKPINPPDKLNEE